MYTTTHTHTHKNMHMCKDEFPQFFPPCHRARSVPSNIRTWEWDQGRVCTLIQRSKAPSCAHTLNLVRKTIKVHLHFRRYVGESHQFTWELAVGTCWFLSPVTRTRVVKESRIARRPELAKYRMPNGLVPFSYTPLQPLFSVLTMESHGKIWSGEETCIQNGSTWSISCKRPSPRKSPQY